MSKLKWWMRIVGVFYLVQFVVMVVVKAPIRTLAPENTLELASTGDRIAMLLVDTWIAFGIEVGVIGAALLLASRVPERAKVLAWTVIGIELLKGPPYDIYMMTRGYDSTVFIVWIVVHSIVILTGILALRSARQT
jgi:BphX-like protein